VKVKIIDPFEFENETGNILRDKAKYKGDYICLTIEDFQDAVREIRDNLIHKQHDLLESLKD
jgi:hypothetical protein